jgi:hypothetical protein
MMVMPFDSDKYSKLSSAHIVLNKLFRTISKDDGVKYVINDDEGFLSIILRGNWLG